MECGLPETIIQLLGKVANTQPRDTTRLAEELAQALTAALVKHASLQANALGDVCSSEICAGSDCAQLLTALDHLSNNQLDQHLLASCCAVLDGGLNIGVELSTQDGLHILQDPVVWIIGRCAARRCQRTNLIPAAVRQSCTAIWVFKFSPFYCYDTITTYTTCGFNNFHSHCGPL